MAKKKSKKPELTINLVYFLAAVFSISFLMGSIIFLGSAENRGREETVSYIQKSTQQSEYAVTNKINEIFHTLSAVSLLSESTQPEELVTMGPYFNKLGEENNFLRFGFVNLSGEAEWVDAAGELNRVYDPAAHALLEQVTQGEWVISDTMRDQISNVNVNYYMVPTYRNGEFLGAIYAVCSVNELRNIMDTALFGGKGFSHIIDQQGNYIVRSNNPMQTGTSDENIFIAEPPMPEDEEREMLETMAARENGIYRRDTGDVAFIVCYEPMNVNDWYIIYVLPEDEINGSYRYMVNGATVLILVAVLLFIIFIFLIRQINDRNRKSMEVLAYSDPLTGYGNYQKFLLDGQDILDRENGREYSLWYYDIKNFKYINDIYGYAVGDNVLKYWANIFSEDMREDETFARVGADNFVCLRWYTDERDLRDRFAADVELIENYPETALNGYVIEVSAGIYLLNSKDGYYSLNDMQDRANVAQKTAKAKIGSHYSVYSHEIRERIYRENEMETHMASALEDGEFEMHLQPKIDIQHGNRVGGMEALVRWNWPGKGLVPPSEFIPLFEKNGFIVRLDQYMMETACRNYKKYVLEGSDYPRVLSVNVSRLCLLQPNFVEVYTEIKDRYQIPDGCIELEFTESIVFENFELFRKAVHEFRKRGFLVSIDDFGSGYSSLNLLKNMEVDVLKLDRLFFVPGESVERDTALVRSIIDMAIALGMRTVAEGVETMEQVTKLRRMGCDMVQGYVFSKPLPIEDFRTYVKEHDNRD